MKRGLLTRPLETYTEEEMGALLLLPGFVAAAEGPVSSLFSQFNEIGSLLQHVGGRGEVRNTDHGTLEIALHFPVPFTIMEAALVRTCLLYTSGGRRAQYHRGGRKLPLSHARRDIPVRHAAQGEPRLPPTAGRGGRHQPVELPHEPVEPLG